MDFNEKYYYIKNKLNLAHKENNKRKITIWKNKLEKWQLEYGAYAPIK